jgi:DNA-binding PadR family transcriptional regulator
MGEGREYLGEFEQVVLLALGRLGDGGYGAEIHAEILETTGRDVSIPAVYVTLKRLEGKGMVASETRRPPDGGRAVRVYTLESAGSEALHRSRDLFERLWDSPHLDPGGAS